LVGWSPARVSQVVQPSMRDFDVRKYQGRWYELGFHDWTQFQEVYATTLDIELSKDGGRWVDDFGVKGPAPLVAARSWDKSPVANGAHYFLYGKVDKATPGVLQVRLGSRVPARRRSPRLSRARLAAALARGRRRATAHPPRPPVRPTAGARRRANRASRLARPPARRLPR
jgi:hypothetical protein